MPVLGVCGDSWFAATQELDRKDCRDSKGKHFSEILAKKLNYDLYTLARGACSNSAIRLQISELVKRKVDFIIVGVTTANRIEYPRHDNKKFVPDKGIHNICYDLHPDQSSDNVNANYSTMYSDTLTNIFGNGDNNSGPVRSEEQREAIKNYYLEVFDINFRETQDAWIIASGIQEIRDAKIPYLLLGYPWLDNTKYFNKGNDREILYDAGRGLVPACRVKGPINTHRRWHTTDEEQAKIAETLHKHITQKSLLQFTQNSL